MLIKSLSANDDKETFRALQATVTLVEIPVARVKTVKISKASQTTIDTKMAELNVDYVDQSALSKLTGLQGYKLLG